MPTKAKRYAEAGVNIEAADRLVAKIKNLASSTFRKGVLTQIGGFAGLFALDVERYQRPVLVSATDGVGTKIKVAAMAGKHKGIGIDLVAMCVNDIIVTGAAPLFFLDYLAFGKIDENIALELIEGITQGCKEADCALIGGETAEMPGMYAEGEYDCVGFTVGVVERDAIIDGSEISVDDIVLGLASNGLHSNGFSLVRKIIFEELGLSLDDKPEGLDVPLGEELLKPTRIYVKAITGLLRQGYQLKGLAHITGGGFFDNIPRVLPRGCKAVIKKDAWEMPAVFKFLQEAGKIPEEEMFQTFNCGIGMILIVSPEKVQDVKLILKGLQEQVYEIGHIEARHENEPPVILI
ncbi:phosphoribosylformylglycinamidine cyclo-ligase [Thermodesulfatator atlanticus]|uniref:phosphoribosylformylglycinamidine cyclo-ligase n=1 Tax=Thermodesulfatator atlanticus TaxID=501497 RepID=UPI0003B7A3A9|nr:phosphoribosylformylglycinamidine cyclo-ligase [Thermodesulfatator atlanticus]